eukprot:CAMPEP_0169478816 /NCGR_PEP_ID=MMETSP1042-20121227/28676_1 /TAXON_ID=464988 /ORGANISM="Hemiselmis andersenii, Strain CCMP1180" /LENGTH=283 /DNA_ID=CAMNT_0009593307 /DNA_START=341 /DNA_END=1192 /DNA_ORIENTATION=+
MRSTPRRLRRVRHGLERSGVVLVGGESGELEGGGALLVREGRGAPAVVAVRPTGVHELHLLDLREVEADNVQALRATEASTGLRQRAATAQGAQQGQMLVADSEREAARAEMLNRQSAEAAQSNQLFDAEADESLAYMSMFGADAQQADQRLKGESMKLQALGRQYARGRFLAQNGAARDQYLKAELAKAKKALDRSELVSEDDKLAFMTGEKATQATAKEVGVEERAAVGNTEKAAGEARKLDEDKAQWEEDSAQADSIKRAAEEHARAEEHLEAASTLNPK